MGDSVGEFFGGGSKETTTENRIPDWLSASGRRLVGYGEDLAKKPYEAYTGERVAPLSAYEREGMHAAGTVGRAYTPYLSQAADQFAGADRRFTDADMGAYMNPYIDGVLEPAAREMGEAFERQRNQRNLTSAQRGAFGGLRNEIGNDMLDESYLEGIGDLYARGRGDAWDRATGLWQADRAQQQDLGGQYAGLADSAAALRREEADALMGAGGLERGIDQAGRDFDYSQYLDERDWDVNRMQPWLSAIGGVPYNTTSTSETVNRASGGQILTQLAGGATSIGGSVGRLGELGAQGKTLGSTLANFGKFFSSRDFKEDGRPVPERGFLEMIASLSDSAPELEAGPLSHLADDAGGSPDAGPLSRIADMPIESWRYKGDGERHIGPYAEDAQEQLGIGNGRSIPVVDAIGTQYAGLSEAARRIKALEDRVGA